MSLNIDEIKAAIKHLENGYFCSEFFHQKNLLIAYLKQQKYYLRELEQSIHTIMQLHYQEIRQGYKRSELTSALSSNYCYAPFFRQKQLVKKNLESLKNHYSKSYSELSASVDFYLEYIDSHYLRAFLAANFSEGTINPKKIKLLCDYAKFLESSGIINHIFYEAHLSGLFLLVLGLMTFILCSYLYWLLITAQGTPVAVVVMMGLVWLCLTIMLLQLGQEVIQNTGRLFRGIENKNKLLEFSDDVSMIPEGFNEEIIQLILSAPIELRTKIKELPLA